VATMEFAPGPAMQVGRAWCAAARLDVAEPRIIVMGGRRPRGNDDDDDDDGYNDGYNDLSTTEVLAFEHHRTAWSTRCQP